jgi:ABC-2 type transport system permease protein
VGRVIESIIVLTRRRPSEGAARRIGAIAAFEIGRQMRHPGFWISTAILFGVALLVVALQSANGSAVLAANAPQSQASHTLALTIVFMLGAVAMASDAALRESRSGFEPILRATPQTRFENVLGRFLGLQVAALVAFTLAMSGLPVGAAAPWIERATVSPTHWGQLGLIWLVIGAPSVLALTAGCFALATWLRSAPATYVVAIVAITLAMILPAMVKILDGVPLLVAALVEPFGLTGFTKDVEFWTVAQRSAQGAPLTGYLALNRAVVLAEAVLLLGAALWLERREDAARLRRGGGDPGQAAVADVAPLRPVTPRFGLRATALQFLFRLRLELKALLGSPSLWILCGVLLLIATLTLWTANSAGGSASLPATRVLAGALRAWLVIMVLLTTTFYAGETLWRERDRKVSELIDATPTPSAVLLAAKVVAVVCTILLLALGCVLAAVGVQLAKGYAEIDLDQYVRLLIVPVLQGTVFLMALSIAAAALSPHRFVAWAVVGGTVVALATASGFGFSHPLFDFFAGPDAPLSEMNPEGDGGAARFWISLYWLLWSGVALTATWLFWPRGQRASDRTGLARAGRLLRGPGGLLAGALVVATLATGGWIFVNTVIWNPFVPDRLGEARTARLERELTPLLSAPQPSVADTQARIELEPRRSILRARGRLILENRTGASLARFHVMIPADVSSSQVVVQGARVASRRDDLLTFQMARPLAPGGRTELLFATAITPRGFPAKGGRVDVTGNGTFVRSPAFIPLVGIDDRRFLRDPAARRRNGLSPNRPLFEPGDPRAISRNYIRAEWTRTDLTVVTDADQKAVAPGRRVSDLVIGDRRTARFVSEVPILNWFSIQSARYAVRRARHGDVDLAIYYHPGHDRNVDRMMAALKGGLNVYEREFGPYRLSYLRIVEFPAYGDYAQAFAGTIPFSENAGFIADLRKPERYDYVTGITLHELAHQWWGHQLVGADARGARLLSEGLADYSAVMAQSRLQGFEMANRSLGQSYQGYLRGRGARRDKEPAVVRENGERYVAYHRATFALTCARLVMGEARLHAALRAMLADHPSGGPFDATSLDLVAHLKAEAPAKSWPELERHFTRVTPAAYAAFGRAGVPVMVRGEAGKGCGGGETIVVRRPGPPRAPHSTPAPPQTSAIPAAERRPARPCSPADAGWRASSRARRGCPSTGTPPTGTGPRAGR